MMATTHGLWGVTVGAILVARTPEFAPVAAVAGFVGGVAPDLDVYASHRRTLHAPVYGSGLAVLAVSLAVLVPSTVTVAIAACLAAASVHALMDVAGGGLSLEPWADEPDRAVYSHYHDQWVPPRRWIRYDGSPEDLLVAALVGVPLLVVVPGLFRWGIALLLVASVAYVAVRKHLVAIVSVCLAHTPASLSVLVPRRFEHLDE
jgi:hypothetical protein